MRTDTDAFEALTSVTPRTTKRPSDRGRVSPPRPPKPTAWYRRFPRPTLEGALQHLFFLGGLGAVTVGCYMAYHPLGPLVGGLISAALGLLVSDSDDQPKPQAR